MAQTENFVKELILGIQFQDAIFDEKDIFELYAKHKDKFPTIAELDILPNTVFKNGKYEFKKLMGKQTRKHLISQNKYQLFQIQRDMFFFNWRSIDENVYPSFDKCYEVFKNTCLSSEIIKKNYNSINQFEMTYINHIEIDKIRKFSFINSLVPNNDVLINYQIVVPNDIIDGEVRLSVNTAFKKLDENKIIVSEIKIRGITKVNEFSDVDKWFKESHSIANNLFKNIVSKQIIKDIL